MTDDAEPQTDSSTGGATGAPSSTRPGRWRRRLGVAFLSLLTLLVLAIGAFVVWASSTPDVGLVAERALVSDSVVAVAEDDGWVFTPSEPASTGLILYPGGRVDPASYAVLARPIAEAGFVVVVPSVRLNLAVLEPNVADDVMAAHPDIQQWFVGGHSLGGAMSAAYANDNRDDVAGLVLLAAFPAGGTDLSDSNMNVVSVYGTNDGLVSDEEVEDSRTRLPERARFVPVEGGNHAQFGDYGDQGGDNEAAITPDEQWRATAEAILSLMIGPRGGGGPSE